MILINSPGTHITRSSTSEINLKRATLQSLLQLSVMDPQKFAGHPSRGQSGRCGGGGGEGKWTEPPP